MGTFILFQLCKGEINKKDFHPHKKTSLFLKEILLEVPKSVIKDIISGSK